MQNLPLLGACGVVAMLVGPLACVPINLGAWLLEIVARRMSKTVVLAPAAGVARHASHESGSIVTDPSFFLMATP
jgi:hypothetical protein